MSELSNPYIDTILYSKVLLTPLQINNDIYISLKNNLKKKIEKKCNRYGYITKIYKLLDYSEGEIISENFDASVVYNIKYSCRLCKPLNNSRIICNIDLLNKSLIKCSNGPIICIVNIGRINESVFNIDNNGDIINIQDNKKLEVNDKIIIEIKGINFFPDDTRIVILGLLQYVPTEDDIKEYYHENLEVENISENIVTLDGNDSESNNISENMYNSNYKDL